MAVKFKYKKSLYTKQGIKDSGIWKQEQLKDEVNRLARYKNARLERLQDRFPRSRILKETDKAKSWSELLDEHGNPNMTQVSAELNSSYRFLKSDTTTVKKFERQLDKSIRSFNKLLKTDAFNRENVWDLFDFLDDYRTMYQVQEIPDSDRVLNAFEEAVINKGMSAESLLENIDTWKKHYEDLRKIDKIKSDRPISSEEYESLL